MLTPDEYVELPKYEHLAKAYAAITTERDEWKRRCQNIVEAMRHHGYSAESLARIAEGRDNG